METLIAPGTATATPTAAAVKEMISTISKPVVISAEEEILEEIATPAAPALPVFTFSETTKGLGNITINSNELRKLLCSDLEDSPLSPQCIEEDDDADHVKVARLRASSKPVRYWFDYLEEINDITESLIEESSNTEVSFSDFELFRNGLKEHYDAYAAKAVQAFDSGTVTFENLEVALSTKKDK
jgi:hypothetical protein